MHPRIGAAGRKVFSERVSRCTEEEKAKKKETKGLVFLCPGFLCLSFSATPPLLRPHEKRNLAAERSNVKREKGLSLRVRGLS